MAEAKESEKDKGEKAEKKENPVVKKEGFKLSWEHIVLAAVFVLVFFGIAYYLRFQNLQVHSVYGVKVLSAGDARLALAQSLSPEKIVMEVDVYSNPQLEDNRNGLISALSADVAYAVSSGGKKVSVYGKVVDTGEYVNGSCSVETNFCANPQIVLTVDDCNCVKVQGGVISVLYDKQHLSDADLRYTLRGMFGGIVTGKQDAPNVTGV